MATLITAENPGKWSRRCDAKCHEATGPECDCICGGRYHGKGNTPGALEEAVRQTADEWLGVPEQFAREDGGTADVTGLRELREALNQGRLFS